MKKLIIFSLFFMAFGASADSLNRFARDIDEFYFTSERSLITKKKFSGEVVSEREGKGCAAYIGAKGNNLELVLMSELEIIKMEVESAKYDQITKTYSFEETFGAQQKMRFLVGKGYKLHVTGSSIKNAQITTVKCSFLSYKAD